MAIASVRLRLVSSRTAVAATLGRVPFQLGQHPPTQAEPADAVGHPDPFDLGGGVAVEFDRAAADRLAVEGGEQEHAGGRDELVVVDRIAQCRVEPVVESLREVAGVGAHARPGPRVARRARLDDHHRGEEQPFDLGHRRDEPFAALLGERFEDRPGEPVGALVKLGPLGPAGVGECGDPYPAVAAGLDRPARQ